LNVTIIGPGNMGCAIGALAAAGGHSVTFVGKTPGSAEQAVEDLKTAVKNGAKLKTASLEDVELGDIVVLALRYGTNIDVVKQLGDRLAGKVVVDIANPVNCSNGGPVTKPDSCSAEDVADAVAPSARVVKAFNTTYAGTLRAGIVDGHPLGVLLAGDDEEAKEKVAQLIRDAGMRPVDAGPMDRARQIEGMPPRPSLRRTSRAPTGEERSRSLVDISNHEGAQRSTKV
jgi:8-hydroxy-5-deazaflavin:NADPH oxidoreductase